MKKLLLIILALGIFSCSKKNIFKEAATDMNGVIAETGKIYEAVESSKEEVPEMSTDKIKELNENFKKKYENEKIEASTIYEQSCREGIQNFSKFVDGFLEIYQKRIEAKNKKDPNLSKTLNLTYAQMNLSMNFKEQKAFFERCELAGNQKK